MNFFFTQNFQIFADNVVYIKLLYIEESMVTLTVFFDDKIRTFQS